MLPRKKWIPSLTPPDYQRHGSTARVSRANTNTKQWGYIDNGEEHQACNDLSTLLPTAVWTVYIRRPGCLHGSGKDMRQEITLLVCERHDKKEKRDDGRGRAKGPLRPPNMWIGSAATGFFCKCNLMFCYSPPPNNPPLINTPLRPNCSSTKRSTPTTKSCFASEDNCALSRYSKA